MLCFHQSGSDSAPPGRLSYPQILLKNQKFFCNGRFAIGRAGAARVDRADAIGSTRTVGPINARLFVVVTFQILVTILVTIYIFGKKKHSASR